VSEIPYALVAQKFLRGRVVPFLGAGVNRYGRSAPWRQGLANALPDGGELARHLAAVYRYLDEVRRLSHENGDENGNGNGNGNENPLAPAQLLDLARVSQFVALTTDEQQLYDDLHDIFAATYDPNDLHRFFAQLPRLFRARGLPPRYQLIVTTNYDDALERSFAEEDEKFDLLYYASDRHGKGWFRHLKPDGSETQVKDAQTYGTDLLEQRSVILKIHGAINRGDRDRDSFVITEDDYIEYLADSGISGLVPKALMAKMIRSNFLFLGYSMRDWNVRAFLQRLWSDRPHDVQSWAIQLEPDTLERKFWEKRSVAIHEVRLEDYVEALTAEMDRQLDAAAPLVQSAP
jgi:hypothetical protein